MLIKFVIQTIDFCLRLIGVATIIGFFIILLTNMSTKETFQLINFVYDERIFIISYTIGGAMVLSCINLSIKWKKD